MRGVLVALQAAQASPPSTTADRLAARDQGLEFSALISVPTFSPVQAPGFHETEFKGKLRAFFVVASLRSESQARRNLQPSVAHHEVLVRKSVLDEQGTALIPAPF